MKYLFVLVAFATFFIKINAEKFSCEGRASGYYADVNTGCQVYHMCDGLGRQFSYSCPNTTLFQQRMLICDHWYMVNCSKSEVDYKANLLIGQRDKPFVEDSSEHPYHRTPRPDLLQQPHAPSNRDEEYRQGRAHHSLPASLNLVGVATDDDAEDELGHRKNFTTDRPQYFLPSHWSTQYGKYVTTPLPLPPKSVNSQFLGVGVGGGKVASDKRFTDFKDVRKQPSNPPKIINPRVDSIPAIPDSVNQESVSPSTLALPPFVAPSFAPAIAIAKPSIFYQPPKLSAIPLKPLDVESTTMDPQSFYKIPSKDLLPPPLLQPQLPQLPTAISTTTTTSPVRVEIKVPQPLQYPQSHPISEKRWKELRQMFFIPEYDFPLESGSRPSYESGLSSFQVNMAPPIPEAFRRPQSTPGTPGAPGPRAINPDCPKCDPAFLAPGTCKPCVMIR